MPLPVLQAATAKLTKPPRGDRALILPPLSPGATDPLQPNGPLRRDSPFSGRDGAVGRASGVLIRGKPGAEGGGEWLPTTC